MDMLPQWCIPLPDAEQMRQIDRWAIDERGVPSLDLMERAGEAVAAAVERICPDGPVAVLCGKGNNGGDGLVAARLLRQAGREVAVLSAADTADLQGDALRNLQRLPGDPPLPLSAADGVLSCAAAIVDGLLGTGFRGVPEGAVADAIAAIDAAARAPVVAIDVPSGVDASTGAVAGGAVRATVTVTFHAAKPGLWIFPGKAHAGRVEVVEIGIPRGAPQRSHIGLIDRDVVSLAPRRTPGSTKFTSGHVLVVGGSRGLTGAPRMAAEGAMRAGAGYVTACVQESLQQVLATGGRPEMMTRGLPEQRDGGALAPEAAEQVLAAAQRGGALLVGPGLGRGDGAAGLARALAARAQLPLVLDADALNAHAGALAEISARNAPTVLTPHAGELARLLELDDAEHVQRRRLACAREAAQRSGAIVVLKGDDTLVAAPDGPVAVSPGGSPALATAGTGDVLGGVIAALIAQGLDAFAAACCGVVMHLDAGRIAAARVGCAEGVLAGDVIDALPRARSGAAEVG